MRKTIAMALLILAALFIAGCQSSVDKSRPNTQSVDKRTTVAGIGLGDSAEDVKKKLGNDYTSKPLEGDQFGESISRWFYGDDIEVIVGDESQKVFQVNLYNGRDTTSAGDRIGDKADKVLSAYQKYPLARDHFEGNEIPGWFVMEKGVWLIFNFKDDDTLVNQTIEAGDQVKSIHLVYEKYID